MGNPIHCPSPGQHTKAPSRTPEGLSIGCPLSYGRCDSEGDSGLSAASRPADPWLPQRMPGARGGWPQLRPDGPFWGGPGAQPRRRQRATVGPARQWRAEAKGRAGAPYCRWVSPRGRPNHRGEGGGGRDVLEEGGHSPFQVLDASAIEGIRGLAGERSSIYSCIQIYKALTPPPAPPAYRGATEGPGPPSYVGSSEERPCPDLGLCAPPSAPAGAGAAAGGWAPPPPDDCTCRVKPRLKGGWLPPPSSQGSPMFPTEGGPKILKLKPSWHQRRRSKLLTVSLKHSKGRRSEERGLGGGGGLLWCTAVLIHPWARGGGGSMAGHLTRTSGTALSIPPSRCSRVPWLCD